MFQFRLRTLLAVITASSAHLAMLLYAPALLLALTPVTLIFLAAFVLYSEAGYDWPTAAGIAVIWSPFVGFLTFVILPPAIGFSGMSPLGPSLLTNGVFGGCWAAIACTVLGAVSSYIVNVIERRHSLSAASGTPCRQSTELFNVNRRTTLDRRVIHDPVSR